MSLCNCCNEIHRQRTHEFVKSAKKRRRIGNNETVISRPLNSVALFPCDRRALLASSTVTQQQSAVCHPDRRTRHIRTVKSVAYRQGGPRGPKPPTPNHPDKICTHLNSAGFSQLILTKIIRT